MPADVFGPLSPLTPDTARLQAYHGPPATPPTSPSFVPQGVPPAVPVQPRPRRRRLWLGVGTVALVALILFTWWGSTLPDGEDGGAANSPSAGVGPVTSAPEEPTTDPTNTPTARAEASLVAQRGTPTVDGHGDDWAGSTFAYSDKVIFGDHTGILGRTQLMWDDEALYFLTEVVDGDLRVPDPSRPDQLYNGDGVSLELGAASFELGEDAKLRASDRHFMFGIADDTPRALVGANKPSKDRTTFTRGGRIDGVEAFGGLIDGGYQIEGRIPWSTAGLDGIGEGAQFAANINVSDQSPVSGRLACMVSTNGERTSRTQPRPGYWQVLELQG